jgi:hypothetical protein
LNNYDFHGASIFRLQFLGVQQSRRDFESIIELRRVQKVVVDDEQAENTYHVRYFFLIKKKLFQNYFKNFSGVHLKDLIAVHTSSANFDAANELTNVKKMRRLAGVFRRLMVSRER